MNLAAIRLPKLWLGVLTVLDKNFHISLLLNSADQSANAQIIRQQAALALSAYFRSMITHLTHKNDMT